MKAADGTTIKAKLALSGPVKGSSAVAAQDTFGGSLPCTSNPQEDAAFVGNLTLTNEHPDFTPDLRITMSDDNGPTSVGTENGCTDLSTPDAGIFSPIFTPEFSGAVFGPVGVEFVVHNYYTPADPQGDPNVLANADVTISAFEGSPPNSSEYALFSGSKDFTNGNSTEAGVFNTAAAKLRLSVLASG